MMAYTHNTRRVTALILAVALIMFSAPSAVYAADESFSETAEITAAVYEDDLTDNSEILDEASDAFAETEGTETEEKADTLADEEGTDYAENEDGTDIAENADEDSGTDFLCSVAENITTFDQLQAAINDQDVEEIIVSQTIALPDGTDLDGNGKLIRVETPYLNEDGTVNNGYSTYPVFSVDNSTVTVRNMNIMGGFVDEQIKGGGIYSFKSTLTLRNVTVTRTGVGVCSTQGKLLLIGCYFTHNRSRGNSGPENCSGGAIDVSRGRLIMDDCSVTENYGTAVCFWHGNELKGTERLYANNCVFANNGGSGNCYGAAVLCMQKGNQNTYAYFMNCTISGNVKINQADHGPVAGLGSFNAVKVYLVNCLVTDNVGFDDDKNLQQADFGVGSGDTPVTLIKSAYTGNDHISWSYGVFHSEKHETAAEYEWGSIMTDDGASPDHLSPVLSYLEGNAYAGYIPVSSKGSATTGGIETFFDYSDPDHVKAAYRDNMGWISGMPNSSSSGTTEDMKVTTYFGGGEREPGVIGASGVIVQAPVLSGSSVWRTEAETATVRFRTDAPGTYYYKVTGSAEAPGAASIAESASNGDAATGTGEAEKGTVTLTDIAGLTAGEKYLHVVLKSGELFSNVHTIALPFDAYCFDDFDSYDEDVYVAQEGSPLSPLEQLGTGRGNEYQKITEGSDPDKMLQLESSQDADATESIVGIAIPESMRESDHIRVMESDVLVPAENTGEQFKLFFDADTDSVGIQVYGNKIYDYRKEHELSDFSAGTWHHVKIRYSPAKTEFDVYLDGELIGTHLPGSAEGSTKICFTPGCAGNENGIYLARTDNIEYHAFPMQAIEPSVTITGWTYGDDAGSPSLTEGSNPGGGAVTYEYKEKNEPDTSYSETVPTDAGTYTVRASIAETWYYLAGSDTADFTIAKADVPDVTVDIEVPSGYASGGTYDLPDPKGDAAYAAYGTVGGATPALISGILAIEDNILTYTTSSQPDGTTATVTIDVTGAKNYNDYKVVLTFTAKVTGDSIWIEEIADQPYTAAPIRPVPVVHFRDRILTEKDYTVSYANNTNAAQKDAMKNGKSIAPSVTVKGVGNYSGSATEYFTIAPIPMTDVYTDMDAVIAAGKANYHITLTFDGKKEQKLAPILKADLPGGKTYTLKKGTDFTLSRETVKDAETYEVTVTGRGNYGGTRTLKIMVKNATPMSKLKIPAIPDQMYDKGKAYILEGIPEVGEKRVVDKSGNPFEWTLTDPTKQNQTVSADDYEIFYVNNIEPGTATVTVVAKDDSDYVGSASTTFKIQGIAMSKVTFPKDFFGTTGKTEGNVPYSSLIAPKKGFIYTGIPFEPAGPSDNSSTDDYGIGLVFSYNDSATKAQVDVPLIKGTDYTVFYEKNIEPGTATVIFTGKGGYTGSVSKSFKILPQDLDTDGIKVMWPEPGEIKEWKALTETTTKNDVPKYEYIKNGLKPEPVVEYKCAGRDDEILKMGTDYALTWSNNTKPGDFDARNSAGTKVIAPTVTITGKGRFTGKIYRTFTIDRTGIMDAALQATDLVYQKDKAGIYSKTKIIVKDSGGQILKSGTDYYALNDKDNPFVFRFISFDFGTMTTGTVKYKDGREWKNKTINVSDPGENQVDKSYCIPAGAEIEVTVTGKGYYEGQIAKGTFFFGENDFSKVSATVPDQIFRGSPVELSGNDISVSTKINGVSHILTFGRDFVVVSGSYEKNTDAGTAKVTLKGVPRYGFSGEKTVTFKIVTRQLKETVHYDGNKGDATTGLCKALLESGIEQADLGDYRIIGTMKDSVIPIGGKLTKNAFKVEKLNKTTGKWAAYTGVAFTGWNTEASGKGNPGNGKVYPDQGAFTLSFIERLLHGDEWTIYAQWEGR